MREHKHRGKREDNGEWIYGYLHVIDTYGHGYTGKAIQQQFGTARPFSVRVIDETVGEYTGLHDKNGKEIYEGDILKYHFKSLTNDPEICKERIAPVYWNEFRATWAVKDGKLCNSDLFNYVQNGNVTKVIGNVHQNAELMEG
jgi:uncharacterized phage protein (TIGR01671 family)